MDGWMGGWMGKARRQMAVALASRRQTVKTVGVREARRRLGELVDAAERGESVIITRWGREVARLGPVAPQGERRLPDLSEFRQRIQVRGEPLSKTVAALRERERF